MSPKFCSNELLVEGGRVQQAGAWDREEGLFGAGGAAGVIEIDRRTNWRGEMKRLPFALILLSVLAVYVQAQAERRDGNWWVGETPDVKLNYAVGFFDGMKLGYNFSYWGMTKESDKKVMTPCMSDVNKSYSDYSDKYFSNVTNDQLVDGLDNFYKDYRNRKIKVPDAVWLVVNSISGKPQNEMDKMIENWRQSASKHD
jgi:hypothetical protein